MAEKINPLILSYPQFTLGEVIDPEHANQNNYDIANKVNEFIDDVELTRQMVEDAQEDATLAVNTANTKGDLAISTANSAVTSAGTANTTANAAVVTANAADGKADAAVSTANTALGQDTVEPYTGALGAIKIANAVKDDYETQKPLIEQAVIDAEAAVASVAGKADVAYVDQEVQAVVLGQIPNSTITDAKLSNTAGQIKDKVASLETSKGVSNGIATLDATGNVPIGQLGNVPSGEDTFDFDNFYGRQGHTYKTIFDTPSAGDTTEEIRNTISDDLVASKLTEFDTPSAGQIQETLYVTEDDITVRKTTTFNVDGSIDAVITEVII